MQDYETLIAEHDHMDRLSAHMAAAVSGARNVAEALTVRADLSEILTAHLSWEDCLLYDNPPEANGQTFSDTANASRHSFVNLVADWADYLAAWNADCVAADWAGFAASTDMILDRLRARMAEENALLYPLALSTGRIRLRAAA